MTAPVTNKKRAVAPINATLPDGATIQSTHTCDLLLPQLPLAATKAHIIPGLATSSLLSVGKLVDDKFKNHFVAGLCSVDKQFPMHLWCELLPQATLTLNLLRTSRINPTISAATQLFGQFYFNRTPLAPPGTRAVAHVKPKARRTWRGRLVRRTSPGPL
jgi:hypothetical protein